MSTIIIMQDSIYVYINIAIGFRFYNFLNFSDTDMFIIHIYIHNYIMDWLNVVYAP